MDGLVNSTMNIQNSATSLQMRYVIFVLIGVFFIIIVILILRLVGNKEKSLPQTKTKAADITYKKVIDLSSRDVVNSDSDSSMVSSGGANIVESSITPESTINVSPTGIDVRTTPNTTVYPELSVTEGSLISPTSILLADSSEKTTTISAYVSPTVFPVRSTTPELPAAGSIHIPLVIFFAASMLVFFSFLL